LDENIMPLMKLECDHSFHQQCITIWFRSEDSHGRCPNCRADPEITLCEEDRVQRIAYMRRVAQRPNAPQRLKDVYRTLVAAERKRQASLDTYAQFLEQDVVRACFYLQKKYRKKLVRTARDVEKIQTKLILQESSEALPLRLFVRHSA
jgi:hypothetical protein